VTRYFPSRHYLTAGLVAVGLAALSGYWSLHWPPALLASLLFLMSAALCIFLAVQPGIEVTDEYLAIGRRIIPWADIRRLDRTGWLSPLVVYLTVSGNKRMMLIFPGDLESSNGLLRQLRRCAKDALIDGIPYRQFWGEAVNATGERRAMASPKYRLLREDDEAEVERLYQRLKAVGHLEPKKSSDEK
jgi:hypothetical protein